MDLVLVQCCLQRDHHLLVSFILVFSFRGPYGGFCLCIFQDWEQIQTVPGPGDEEFKPRSSNPCGKTVMDLCCLSPWALLGPTGKTENMGWRLEEKEIGDSGLRMRTLLGEHLTTEQLSAV